jgi:23S rRNA G2069 N7-methylase RlmK/C1962 C5-methylase RlmI
MPLLGIALTLAGETRLAGRPPQLALSDVQSPEFEPGRPVRLLDARGPTLATGVADPENEVVRVWSHGDDSRTPDAAFLRGKLGVALAHRGTLGLCDGESAYRLVNGEGEGLSGLTADVYGPFAVVSALSRGLLGHARLLAQCALEVLPAAGLPLRGAVLKARLKGSGNTAERAKDDVVGETPPDKLIVRESRVPYEVHLRGGINVGLFTDMREHRAGLGRFVRGKRILNTFAYTGALSVAAARAGATEIIDLAAGPGGGEIGGAQLRDQVLSAFERGGPSALECPILRELAPGTGRPHFRRRYGGSFESSLWTPRTGRRWRRIVEGL